MKGENILYNKVVPSSLVDLATGERLRKKTHRENKSAAIACRYYYHSTLCRLRYDDCLLALSAEFFIEPDTLIEWLKKNVGFVNVLIKKQITAAQLRRRYPHFDWSNRITIIPPLYHENEW